MLYHRLCRRAFHCSTLVQRRRRLVDVNWSRSSSSSSSPWQQYSQNLPWSRANPPTKVDSALEQEIELKRKKLKQLQVFVRAVVQRHLLERHPEIFCVTTMKELNDLRFQKRQQKETAAVEHSVIEKLALLNGFQMVDTPRQEERVPLAEGIVAIPRYYTRIRQGQVKYTLYSQPILAADDEHHHHQTAVSSGMDHLPPLVEPDSTIYRILESRVDDWLNAWRDTFRVRVAEFFQRVATRTVESHIHDSKPIADNMPSARVVANQQQVPAELEENLLVVTDHNLVLMTQMRPSLRLLALPHDLGHKSASTLISVSVVAFGAIPVAYRSFNFALAYPGWATVIKISVIGTILYGIWSTRSIARTSQSQIVAKGLSRRVFARDDAVVLVLQNGAIQRATNAVMDVYLQDSNKIGTLASKRHALPENLVDPVAIALNLGLVEKAKDSIKYKWTKPALDDAIARAKLSDVESVK